MGKTVSPRSLDVESLARKGGDLSGAESLARFERLADLSVPPPHSTGDQEAIWPMVEWHVAAELRRGPTGPAPWLRVGARVTLHLLCQRCLQPLAQSLAFEREIRFVAHEAQAEIEDERSEEDVLSLERRLDLFELIEDELLLAVPLSPRHERCPDAPALAKLTELSESVGGVSTPSEQRQQPFKDLDRLRRL